MQKVCWHGSTLCDVVRGSRHTEHSSTNSSVSTVISDVAAVAAADDESGPPGDSVDMVAWDAIAGVAPSAARPPGGGHCLFRGHN